MPTDLDLQTHRQLATALTEPGCYPQPPESVEHLETHISTVLLAGDLVYKLKKPLDLGFLDFTTLERRKFYCDEEIRLNGRLAPELYLGVSAITGSPAAPRVDGQGEPLDHAVRMRRFPQSHRLDHLLARGELTRELVDQLADSIAAFHQSDLTRGPPPPPMDTVAGLQQPVLENLHHLEQLQAGDNGHADQQQQLDGQGDGQGDGPNHGRAPADNRQRLRHLIRWMREQTGNTGPWLAERLKQARVRECHGDLHLQNIVCLEGRPVPFDGIEFSPQLRWIDVISEVAFLTMDLDFNARPDLAARFLSRYLDATGDHGGVALLRYYQAYRALVRAKVQRIMLADTGMDAEQHRHARRAWDDYLALAGTYTAPGRPCLTITCGLSGSGKSVRALELVERDGAIRLRSDVERKRIHGLAHTPAGMDAGIYSAEASRAVYRHLAQVADGLLCAGWPVVVDAACLNRQQRDLFRELAGRRGVPFRILYCTAPMDELRQRIAARAAAGNDPSDADAQVLEAQAERFQPPREDEQAFMI